ncbi:MAG TPA: bifunctional metallophosphatase/5'-nucleotidase, partial [Myxococcaceae bacterium]|nr:bifunctional metallophosphatase/5'-nucleotidase [Myxococcaceae bacterium]
GEELAEWVALSVGKRGTDGFSQQSGVRYEVEDGKPVNLQVLKNPADAGEGYEPVREEGRYVLGTTDFQAYMAAGYRELMGKAERVERTELDAHELLKEALRKGDTKTTLDGRTGR